MKILNRLLNHIPRNGVVTTSWLKDLEINKWNIRTYEQSGWLKAIGKGAHIRAGENPSWEAGLNALQFQLKKKIHAGGKSAIERKGLGHYIQAKPTILYLFSAPNISIEKWFIENNWGIDLKIIHSNILPPEMGLEMETIGDISIFISSPERAILEMLCYVPQTFSFDETFHIMENLNWLRPDLVQELLESCHSIKGKRLYLFLGDYFDHPWMKRLDTTKINLGTGKRMIFSNGHYDQKYMITVPKNIMDKSDENPIF